MGYLSNVHPNERFILKGGMELRNLVELGNALKTMDQDTFSYHVNEHKNDFASWVSHCVTDQELAENLKGASTSEEAGKIVTDRVKQLISPPDPDRPRPWGEFPPVGIDKIRGLLTNGIAEDAIKDIELLSSSISEESFIRAYKEGNFIVSTKLGDDLVKESEAGISILKKQDIKVNSWDDNYKDLPLFSTDLDSSSVDFFHRVAKLQEHVMTREKMQAKLLYTELKREFESGGFDPADKKSIHALLTSAYRDILELR